MFIFYSIILLIVSIIIGSFFVDLTKDKSESNVENSHKNRELSGEHEELSEESNIQSGGGNNYGEIQLYSSLTIPLMMKYYRWEYFKENKKFNKSTEIFALLLIYIMTSKEIVLSYLLDTIITIILINKYQNEYLSIFPYYFLYHIVR
jgi:hypothetical protein